MTTIREVLETTGRARGRLALELDVDTGQVTLEPPLRLGLPRVPIDELHAKVGALHAIARPQLAPSLEVPADLAPAVAAALEVALLLSLDRTGGEVVEAPVVDRVRVHAAQLEHLRHRLEGATSHA